MKYIAFLRGINVGGHHLIKKERLISIFIGAGFSDVRTVIASGNVIFVTEERDEQILVDMIEKHLLTDLGYSVKVLLRRVSQIQEIVSHNPFSYTKTAGKVKFYVTFLAQSTDALATIPQISKKDGYEIVHILDREIYIVTYLLPSGRFGNMLSIEKTAGKYSTTRNWNTLQKIASLQAI